MVANVRFVEVVKVLECVVRWWTVLEVMEVVYDGGNGVFFFK